MKERLVRFRERSVRSRTRSRRRRRGVALILVLGAIVILTVFVTDLQVTSSATLSAALAERDSERAEYHARSAINLTRLMLGAEPTIRAAIAPVLTALLGGKGTINQLPVWKFTDVILGPFNDADHSKAFANAAGVDMSNDGGGRGLGLSNGHFELKIVDEDSKIDVNSAVAGDAFSRQRLATQLLGVMSSPKYNPMFEEKEDGQAVLNPEIEPPFAVQSSIGRITTRRCTRATPSGTHLRTTLRRTTTTSRSVCPTSARMRRSTRSKSCISFAASPISSGRTWSTPTLTTLISGSSPCGAKGTST